MFEDKSRYLRTEQYYLRDRRGRIVAVVAVPDAISQTLRGYHLHKDGQRTDHLAAQYINDATGFWRICDMNDAMLPDAVSEQKEIAIPNKIY